MRMQVRFSCSLHCYPGAIHPVCFCWRCYPAGTGPKRSLEANVLASSVTASESATGCWISSLKHCSVAAAGWRRRPVVLPGIRNVLSKQSASGGCAVQTAARCLRSCKSLQARRGREEQDECERDRVSERRPMH
jgi:hypothetical protein